MVSDHAHARLPRGMVALLALVTTPFAVLPAAMLAWSSAGLDLDRTACLLLAILSTACAFALAFALLRERRPIEIDRLPSDRSGAATAASWIVATLTVAFAVWAFVDRAQVAWMRPVVDWDGLYYHVPAMHGWARAGRIVWLDGVPDVPFVNGYPMALEALGLWSTRVFGHDRWIDGANLVLWPAAAVGTTALAYRMGARGAWTVVAGAGIALVPGVLVSTATAYVDVGFMAASLVALATTLDRLDGDDARPRWLVWAVTLGLAMGVKGTGLPLAALLIGVVLASALLRRSDRRSRTTRRAFVAVAVALAIGGGWPLRAWLHTGNPIHPIELRVGTKLVAPGYDARASADLALPPELRALPAPLRGPAVWSRPMTPIERYDQTEGLGPLWTFAGAPALALLAVLAWRRRDTALRVFLVTCAVWWFAQPASWWARFTFWIVPLGWAAAIALATSLAASWSRPARAAARLVVTGAAVAAFVVSAATLRADDRSARSLAGLDALDARFPTLRARSAFADALADGRIARTPVGRVGSLLAGALAQPVGTRAIYVIDVTRPPDVLAHELRAHDVEWVLWDEEAVGTLPATFESDFEFTDRADLGGSALLLLRVR